MKKKNIVALLLAVVMSFSFAMVAMAMGTDDTEPAYYHSIELEVVFLSSDEIIANFAAAGFNVATEELTLDFAQLSPADIVANFSDAGLSFVEVAYYTYDTDGVQVRFAPQCCMSPSVETYWARVYVRVDGRLIHIGYTPVIRCRNCRTVF